MIRMIYYELLKLAAQKKNYIMLGGHLLFLLLCYFTFRAAEHEFFLRFNEALEFKLADQTRYLDGFFFARIAMSPTFLVLMPILTATLAGDCVAGEMQSGSLKLFISRPRSRNRIVLAKFLAVFLVTTVYGIWFGLFNLAFGCLVLGVSPTQLVIPAIRLFGTQMVVMSVQAAAVRYLLTLVYFSLAMSSLAAVTLFFSTMFDRMSSATVLSITLYFVSYVIGALPFSGGVRPWLFSEVLNNSFLVWLSPVPVQNLLFHLTTLGLYTSVFLVLAALTFNFKDLR